LFGIFRKGEGRSTGLRFKIVENASVERWFEHIRVSNVDDLHPRKRTVTMEVDAIETTSGRELEAQQGVVDGGSLPPSRARTASGDSDSVDS
jgi:hypothetical protein